jgi:signal transduction histidine kinase
MARIRGPRTLRGNLSLTYAGIALLTAAILGTVLLSVLSGYYARSEESYLRAAAERITGEGVPLADAAALAEWTQVAALGTQTRVRVYDSTGALLADSGSPRELDPAAVVGGDRARGPRGRDRLPEPLGEGIFRGPGRAPGPPSSRSLTLVLRDGAGSVTVSEPPTSGRAVLEGIAQAWLVAAALAVALAAAAGYAVSSRISRPIVALTSASNRMAEGDLTARAEVARDDEVGTLAVSFNAMAGRIETTVSALRRFVADAAHEIGTPLTALQADLELAERAAQSDDERRLVERSLAQARRLEALSTNLLRLSRIEAGEAPGAAETVDAAAIARACADAVASRAEAAGIELRVEVAEALPVAAESAELETVFGNLLDNAVKFTPAGGTVTLSAASEGAHAVFSVADTGIGIPAAEHAEVFGRFHRGRNAAAYPGNGLGLAIVRATVERLGGAVGFESSQDGTRFRIELPLA